MSVMVSRFYITVLLVLALVAPVTSHAAESVPASVSEHELVPLLSAISNEIDWIKSFYLEQQKVLRDEDMRNVITDSVTWFLHAQEANGHFKYEYVPYDDEYLEDDNIVRQAGSLYALGEVAVRDTAGVHDLEEMLVSAASYFESITISGSFEGEDFSCIAQSETSSTCRLGATALALIGILDIMERYPKYEETYAPLAHKYGAYLIAMKMDEKGFRQEFKADKPVQTTKESSFFNGETLLALVRYNRYAQNADAELIIDDVYDYLRVQDYDQNLYLWIMAAVKDLYADDPREEYSAYVEDYTDWRIAGALGRRNAPHNYCAYIEGVVSAYSVLEDSAAAEKLPNYQNEIDFWLMRSSLLQVGEDGQYRIIDGEVKEIERMDLARGGFLTGREELTQRIDFTQHCMSAYLQQLVDVEKKKL